MTEHLLNLVTNYALIGGLSDKQEAFVIKLGRNKREDNDCMDTFVDLTIYNLKETAQWGNW